MQPPLAQNQDVASLFFRRTNHDRLHHAVRFDRLRQFLERVVVLDIPRLKGIFIDVRNIEIHDQISRSPTLRLRMNRDRPAFFIRRWHMRQGWRRQGGCRDSRPRLLNLSPNRDRPRHHRRRGHRSRRSWHRPRPRQQRLQPPPQRSPLFHLLFIHRRIRHFSPLSKTCHPERAMIVKDDHAQSKDPMFAVVITGFAGSSLIGSSLIGRRISTLINLIH